MTHQTENSAIEQVLEDILANGMQGLKTAVSILINEAMKVERRRALGAEPWQRSDQRQGFANGYKPRSLKSRVGKLSL
jgi:transposase-like protein